jgi:WD repeat-containing protein 23
VEGGYGGIGKRRRARDKYPAIPSDVGRALMDSGTFGDRELCEGGRGGKDIRVASRMFKRELGLHTGVREQTQNRLMAQVGCLLGCHKFMLTLSW